MLVVAEEKLARTEADLTRLLASSRSCFYEAGPDLRLTRFTGNVLEVIGADPGALLGKTFDAFLAEQADAPGGIDGMMRQRRPFQDHLARTAGGTRHLNLSGAPLFDSDGGFRGYRGTIGDITKLVAAEDRAATNFQRFSESIECIPASLMFFDRDDRIVICNSMTRRFFPGAAHLLVPGTRFEDLLRADIDGGNLWKIDTNVDDWVATRMKSHRAANVDLVGELPDGRWIHVIERPTSDGGIIGIRVDITALKQTEAALAKKARQLEENVASLHRAQRVAATGSIDFDVARGTAEWTDELYRILGVDRQSCAATTANFLALVHPEDRAKLEASIAAARQQGRPNPEARPQSADYRIIRPDGAGRTVHAEVEAVFDDGGCAAHLIVTLTDVTELRASQQRERELERQLLHSQKLEALGTLAGGIAHDLNNTLTPILALSRLLADEMPAGSEARKDLETIVRASERARDLVQRILAFGRKQEMAKRKVDLAQVTREAIRMLRPALPATVQLVDRIGEVPPLLGDPGQIQQVVVNLVTNAAHAIGDKIGSVTVELCAADRSITLVVADTGCGMDEATAARIFEPFFTTKEVGRGTGLGLSVVHGIVAEHAGQVRVTSRPGQGSRFVVTLPPAGEAVRDNAPAASVA
jgi:signal transduction histidine kinase